MIFATDIDRTLIFSSKFTEGLENEITCVEYKDSNPISYMHNKSLELLEGLKQKPTLNIIPITTRSVEQFKRISVLQDCKYAVVANGGIILYNGEVYKPWQERVNRIKEKYYDEGLRILCFLNLFKPYYDRMPRKVDDLFYFVKVTDNDEQIDILIHHLENFLSELSWNYTLQGRKLYVIPKEISKESALLFLKDHLKENKVITAGDGKLDLGFLSLGEERFIPAGSEILQYLPNGKFQYNSVPAGIEGTISLLENINNL